MVLVAIVALLIWAVREVPRILDRRNTYQHNAFGQDVQAKEFQERRRAQLDRANILRAWRDQWRRDVGSSDPLTERYFASHWEAATVDAAYFGEMADFHAALAHRYRRAAWFPWAKFSPGPPPPRDPLPSRPLKAGSGGLIEPIEGGQAVAFSPAGAGLAVACWDHSIKLLELPSRRVVATFPIPDESVQSVVFSRDGTTLITVGANLSGGQVVRRWDVASHHALPTIPWIDPTTGQSDLSITVGAVAISPDGGTIAVGAGGFKGVSRGFAIRTVRDELYAIRLFDARTGAVIWENKGPGGWVQSLNFSPDGQSLACAHGPVLLLEARTGALKKTLKPASGYVLAAAFSPDGRTLAGAGSHSVPTGGFGGEGRITLWEVEDGRILRTLKGPTGRAQAVAFSPDGRTVAAAGTGPEKERRDTFSGSRMQTHASEVQLWDVATGRMIWAVEGETDAAFSLALSPDGKQLAFCDSDFVYLLNVQTGKLKQIVMETIREVRARNRHTN
jgi:WD40 repeat protein